jgi:hypothetical protein
LGLTDIVDRTLSLFNLSKKLSYAN